MFKVLFVIILIFAGEKLIGQDMLNVLYLDSWTDSTIAAGPEGSRFNEVISFELNNKQYAAIGSNNGVHFFSFENNQLTLVDYVAGAYQSILAENRDYVVYNNYLYAVCDEGNSTLQIIDLQFLPDSVSLVYDSNSLFMTAHTVFVDSLNKKLYACGTNNAAMKILDISNPTNPTLWTDFNGVAYVHDGFVVNDTAYLNCGFDGLRIYKFTSPGGVLLGQLDFYANQGYNHSGWVSPNGQLYAFTDETQGTKIRICELNNLAEIKVDQEVGTLSYQDFIPHEVYLLNSLLFCAYYNEGLRIFDLSTSPPKEIGSYDTFLPESNFKMNGAWGVSISEKNNLIFLSDRQTGIYVFYFPIYELENSNSSSTTIVASSPFINENRILIPRNFLTEKELYFSITSINGSIIYEQENYLNWVRIPLNLAAGTYVYQINNGEGEHLESGKFIILD